MAQTGYTAKKGLPKPPVPSSGSAAKKPELKIIYQICREAVKTYQESKG